jgi:excisionase family DNA binding protein
MEGERMLTTRQVAERLQVKVITVQRWLHAGQMQGINLGGRSGWRVPETAVREFIAQRRHPADKDAG